MVAETRSQRDPGPDGTSGLLSGQALGATLCDLLLWKLYLIAVARIQVASKIIRFDRLATVGERWLEHKISTRSNVTYQKLQVILLFGFLK